MDKRAAGQYMDNLFGKNTGYVAVAYKDKGESWQEQTFAWPKDRSTILGWAEVHHDANLFICPALRSTKGGRIKGDGTSLQWLWADVDMDKVPDDRKDDVQRRIKDLGTIVVASGSGDNRHVYVKLSKKVDVAEHLRLNTGLRNYLYADAKHTDNSLLRLPGTTNWKTDAGSPVRKVGGVVRGKAVAPADLLKIRTFSSVNVAAIADTGPINWTKLEMEGVSRRIQRMVQMTSAEAIAKYGSRHKAVWAIAGELHKRGYDGDMVHTLMDQFPPALEKRDEEHGAYDVHKDVEKRLIWDKANIPALSDEAMEELEDEISEMEVATDEDFAAEVESEIRRLAEQEVKRNRARQMARELEAERVWVAPPADTTWTVTDALERPPRPIPYIIEGLAGAKHNVLLTAQYKSGKTKFIIASLLQSLVDNEPFLGKYEVNVPEGGVMAGHWNCEMDPAELMDTYIRPVGLNHTDNLVVANLRGYTVNILSTQGKQWAVNWLRDHEVKVWTIDSFARLARMCGVSEKDNDEVMSLLMALDQIKVEAGVDVCFLITHTGRAEMEEGKERSRGATALDDWCDARWIMTKVDSTRMLRVDGRSVSMDETALMYDEETGRSVIGFGGRAEVKADGAVQVVVRMVKDNPGCTQRELYALLKGHMGQRVAKQHIEDAEESGFIEIRMDSSSRGKPAARHYVVGMEKPTGDRFMRATPAEVDMRHARVSRRRRPQIQHA